MVTDQLGSTSLMVDSSSPPKPTQRQYYKPYGEIAFQSGSSLTSVGYTGQRLDGGSGLMYYGARYYDPVLSYFISADMIIADSSSPMNYDRYAYVSNNPLVNKDPTGFCKTDASDVDKLDCTVDDFDGMTADQRLAWVAAFQSVFDLRGVFNGVMGAILYFAASSAAHGINFDPGSWMSRADAWTLAAMQNGMSMHTFGKQVTSDFTSLGRAQGLIPGRWASFFEKYDASGKNFMASGVAEAWGSAEMGAVHFGVEQANAERGKPGGMQGFLINWAIGATDYFRARLITRGLPLYDQGTAWDPRASPTKQLEAGMVSEGAARAAYTAGMSPLDAHNGGVTFAASADAFAHTQFGWLVANSMP